MFKIGALVLIAVFALLAYLIYRRASVTAGAGVVMAAVSPCRDEVDKAVLDAIWPRFQGRDYDYLSIWISHNYSLESWRPRLEDEQAEIDHIREWAKGLSDACTRKAYNGWLDHYQRNLDSAYQELKTQAEKKHMDAYEAEQKETHERVANFKDAHPIPQPPRR